MLKNKKLITEKDFRSYKLIYDEQGNLKTDLQLLYALKTWRIRVMQQRKIPSTCIFYNSCLVAFATYYPRTRDEFLRIFGVGKTELDYLDKTENKVIWPFKKLKKEEFIELVDSGYAIITEPISYNAMSSKMFKNKNLYQFYHLTENEDEEVMLIEIFKKLNFESRNKEKKSVYDIVNYGSNKFWDTNYSNKCRRNK